MARINVFSHDPEGFEPRRMVGWFDPDKSQSWAEGTRWNGSNTVSLATGAQFTHEHLYRTLGGRWVIETWSQWEGVETTYRFVSTDEAYDWLIRCDYDSEEVARITGIGVPEETGPGTDATTLKLLLSRELLAATDAEAARVGISRAEWVRQTLAAAVGA